jgi:hypothetical protein
LSLSGQLAGERNGEADQSLLSECHGRNLAKIVALSLRT